MASFHKGIVTQAAYDGLIRQLMEEGKSLEDACEEAAQVFEDMDLNSCFCYMSSAEKFEKDKIEKACSQLEMVLNGRETWVNASFGLQGLVKSLSSSSSPYLSKAWRLVESRQLFLTLIKLLAVDETEDEDEEDEGDEEDDDGEDKDKDLHLKLCSILDLLLFIVHQGHAHLREPGNLFSFSVQLDEVARGEDRKNVHQILNQRLDKSVDDIEICQKLVSLLSIILSKEENKAEWFSLGGASTLELACKMHKSNTQLRAVVDQILCER